LTAIRVAALLLLLLLAAFLTALSLDGQLFSFAFLVDLFSFDHLLGRFVHGIDVLNRLSRTLRRLGGLAAG
jgi:hypothetical protein